MNPSSDGVPLDRTLAFTQGHAIPLNYSLFSFDHSPTLAEIQEKLSELREAGIPKPGIVALSVEDYEILHREVFGAVAPGCYTINVYGDSVENQVRAVAMPSIEPRSIIFGYLDKL